ncbi:MAG: hypothetical protein LBL62_06515 [Planctomycetaceae bacterium]|jgi:hypothetical protein|nr:hypothetical protein [Planctomycetaceae bacterium]
MERAERLMDYAINGRNGCSTDEIVDLFLRGYPIENLGRLFDENNDISTQFFGTEVCYELGKTAVLYMDRVAELMNQDERLKTDYGLIWLADYADETDELADWVILSSLENKSIYFTVTTISILSGINFGQLRGAKAYLLRNIPNSPHIAGIDFYLNYHNDTQHILNMLDDKNVLMQKYAVALASHFFTKNTQIRDKSLSLTDPAIKIFVQREIQQIENLLRIFR